ncbi:SDR family oxidoreductase [Streptomyces sp. SID2888]|uniref:SDR family oxidoreductase n=1 Tax=Streptomyces sp. SID2888 TaxID=2690256 RepID=UPI001368FA34|nr:SDR family oxidoreductase [Streptomyces sp. SID2888]MYV47419.1 SDR family oxidoreductase [Streptomyces sp. SID2888]
MFGRTVLVTGASRGIGLAVSHRLAAQGNQVLGVARTTPEGEFPGVLLTCDLMDAEQTERVLSAAAGEYQVDGVVNNAGIALPEPLGGVSLDGLQQVFDLNVRATIQITQLFVEGMRERGWGRIVNVTSRAVYGARNRSSYSAAKSALVGLTRTWALECATDGVTVNAVAPGPVETELFRSSHPAGSEAEAMSLRSIPMGRLGQPEEVAAAICFLVGEEGGFITGQMLCVDGGGSIPGR